jgi:N-acetylneuraminate lyase
MTITAKAVVMPPFMKSHLTGLIAAPFTPFDHDGGIVLETIPRQAALLAHNGVTGAFVCGTTGEGYSLTVAERKQVASAWRAATPPGLKLIVHVGHLSLADSCELATHAQSIGADAIATIAPNFFKPAGAAELVAWCRHVASAAPELPFYYYHMPAMTGVTIPATDFLRKAEGQIPTLAGVKFTHEDLMDYGQATQVAHGRYAMLFGRDEILIAGLSLGAMGAVGSTYNFAAPLFRRLMNAFVGGDLVTARIEQARARDFITIVHQHGGLAAAKYVMKIIGVDCGPVRLPLRRLTSEQETSLRNALEGVGFFDYCCKLP